MKSDSNQSSVAQKPQTRLLELDILRGIAALAVVACHFTSECFELGRMSFEFRVGHFGAHLFFILSGFVICMTLDRCKRPADFAFSRASRLYPVYWAGIFLSATLIYFCQPYFPYYEIGAKEVLGNLSMCQQWIGIRHIEFSYWTLGVELKFYALMFGLLLIGKQKSIEWFSFAWLLAVVGFRLVDAFVGLPGVLALPLNIDFAGLFVAGIMLYRVRQHGHAWWRHAMILTAIPLQFWAQGSEAAFFVGSFVAVFYLFNAGLLSWIVNRPLKFLGDISYPLYLVHGAIGIVIIQFLSPLGAPVWLMLLLPIVLSVLVAYAFHTGVEKPSLSYLRSWYRASKRRNKAFNPTAAAFGATESR